MSFKAILTNLGLTRLAEAQANSTPLVFAHVAVGDGNGTPINPDPTKTALGNERARVVVNAVDMDPTDSARRTVIVEGLFPVDVGGFTIREAGLFNDAGEMIAIASYPDIYKPVPGDGASVAEYIRIPIKYDNIDTAVAITVDNSVIMATRRYADEGDAGRLWLWENWT